MHETWPDGTPVTPWADPWHDIAADIRAFMRSARDGSPYAQLAPPVDDEEDESRVSDYNGEMVSEAVMGEIIRLHQRNAGLERVARYQLRYIVSLVRQLEALAAKWDETAAGSDAAGREMTPGTTGLPEALVGRSSGIAECARQLRAVIGQPPQEGEDGD